MSEMTEQEAREHMAELDARAATGPLSVENEHVRVQLHAALDPTPARSEAAGGEVPDSDADLLETLDDVVDFAYQHGYHEHGIPLVKVLGQRIASLRQQLAAAERQRDLWWTTCNAHAAMIEDVLTTLGQPDGADVEEAACEIMQQLAAAREDGERLRRFAEGIIRDECWGGASLDGGDVQQRAVALGILAPSTVREPCGDVCQCAEFGFPTECYRFTWDRARTGPAREGEDSQC